MFLLCFRWWATRTLACYDMVDLAFFFLVLLQPRLARILPAAVVLSLDGAYNHCLFFSIPFPRVFRFLPLATSLHQVDLIFFLKYVL